MLSDFECLSTSELQLPILMVEEIEAVTELFDLCKAKDTENDRVGTTRVEDLVKYSEFSTKALYDDSF